VQPGVHHVLDLPEHGEEVQTMTATIDGSHRTAQRSAEPPRRRRGLIAAATACLVLAGAGVGGWLLYAHSSSRSVDTKKAATLVNAGLRAQQRGDLNRAQHDYQAALRADPKDAIAMFDLGIIDVARGNLGLAEQQYQRAIAIRPKYEPALYNLALLYDQRGDQRDALTCYQRAVRSNPNDPKAHYNLALLLRQLGYRSAGDAQMTIAHQLDPQLTDPNPPAAQHIRNHR
jgi:tetratricopeptide (TPR) repeat protein